MPNMNRAICKCCGNEAEYAECNANCIPQEDARCARLRGWMTVSRWNGTADVDELDFCSLTCLEKWVRSELPTIPQAFLQAFEE